MSRLIWWTASILSFLAISLVLPLPSGSVSAAPILNLTTTATPIPPTDTPVPPTDTPEPSPTPIPPPTDVVEPSPTPEPPPTNTPRPRDNDDPDPSPTPTATPEPPTPTLEPPVETAEPPRSKPSISKSADPSTARPGSRVTFTITVRNPGSSPIGNVEVRDSVPSVFEITGASVTQGTVTVNGQSVHAVIGTIGPGESVQLRISTVVRMDTPPGQYDNVAIVTDDTPTDVPGGDPGDPSDNSSTTTVTITNAPPRVLPSTGEGAVWTWQLLLIALFALLGGLAFLVRARAKA